MSTPRKPRKAATKGTGKVKGKARKRRPTLTPGYVGKVKRDQTAERTIAQFFVVLEEMERGLPLTLSGISYDVMRAVRWYVKPLRDRVEHLQYLLMMERKARAESDGKGA